MTTGEQEKVEEATPETVVEATTTEGATQEKPNTQDEVNVLREQIKQIQVNHEKAYKGLQRTLSEKDRKLKELETGLNPVGSHIPTIKAAIDILADESNLDPARVQKLAQLRSQLAIEEQDFRLDTQKRKQQLIVDDEWGKLKLKMAEAGLDPEDDALEGVVDAFEYARDMNGNFEKAHKRLDKVISKVKKTTETKGDGTKVDEKKPEAEAQLRERIEREVLEKHGLLNKEKVNPTSGKGRIYHIEELNDRTFINEHWEDIERAQKEGRIKE